MKSLAQTTELADAVLTVLGKLAKAKQDDGKVSVFEVAGLTVGSLSTIVDGILGAEQVPGELLDLQPEELDGVVGTLAAKHGWPQDARTHAVVVAALNLIRSAVAGFRAIQPFFDPPKAEVVPE